MILNYEYQDKKFKKLRVVIQTMNDIDKLFIGKCCGSFRRGSSSSSGDVDVLITHPKYTVSSKDEKLLEMIVDRLTKMKLLTDHRHRWCLQTS